MSTYLESIELVSQILLFIKQLLEPICENNISVVKSAIFLVEVVVLVMGVLIVTLTLLSRILVLFLVHSRFFVCEFILRTLCIRSVIKLVVCLFYINFWLWWVSQLVVVQIDVLILGLFLNLPCILRIFRDKILILRFFLLNMIILVKLILVSHVVS